MGIGRELPDGWFRNGPTEPPKKVASAPGVGIEPTTFGLTVRCSAELSYPGSISKSWYQYNEAP